MEALTAAWHPVAFERDLDVTRPTRIEILGRALVLFRDGDAWACLPDSCPHRRARLSDGSVHEGTLECSYHGWRFSGRGRCTTIPQLLPGREIPAGAHVEPLPVEVAQDLVWVWTGVPAESDSSDIPAIDGIEECRTTDFSMELPYDFTWLVENVVDVAHIHIAHDGARGGGARVLASALEFEAAAARGTGFAARYRSHGIDRPDMVGAFVEFVAPGLVHFRSEYVEKGRRAGLALHALPMRPGRCRLLYRAYNGQPRLRDVLRPRWLDHLSLCALLEQDMGIVIGQAADLGAGERPLKDAWLPLRSSDELVLKYREWLDEHAAGWGGAPAFEGSRPATAGSADGGRARFDLHTRICATCSTARRVCRRVSVIAAVAIAVATVATAAAREPVWVTTFAVVALGGIATTFAAGWLGRRWD